ncbi:unnamed protein product [Ranitomeya imitator]|uniref:Uncharacterized protein n=1 Tax=Ranitomeya imitator TaxID=111125 RepID=A0ABN9L3U0_9NEOB|nr:unnamed protein product [Ranitomeya imitator]
MAFKSPVILMDRCLKPHDGLQQNELNGSLPRPAATESKCSESLRPIVPPPLCRSDPTPRNIYQYTSDRCSSENLSPEFSTRSGTCTGERARMKDSAAGKAISEQRKQELLLQKLEVEKIEKESGCNSFWAAARGQTAGEKQQQLQPARRDLEAERSRPHVETQKHCDGCHAPRTFTWRCPVNERLKISGLSIKNYHFCGVGEQENESPGVAS